MYTTIYNTSNCILNLHTSLILTDQRLSACAGTAERSHLSSHAGSTWPALCRVDLSRWLGLNRQKCLGPHLSNIFSTSLKLLCYCDCALVYISCRSIYLDDFPLCLFLCPLWWAVYPAKCMRLIEHCNRHAKRQYFYTNLDWAKNILPEKSV